MPEDLNYEEMHRRIREKYETPPTKVFAPQFEAKHYEPVDFHSPIDFSNAEYFSAAEEGDTGDYEDDDYYESDEYADEATDVIDPDYTGDPADYYDSEEYGRKASALLDARDALAAARDHRGVQSIEIPQSQVEARQKYQNILEEMKVDAGARGQATTKPEPKPPTKPGYARVTAPEREGPIFMPWETEGMTDEELMRIGAHPSQKKTLPPMDTTRKSTVADKERRAQQVVERQAAKEGTGAQRTAPRAVSPAVAAFSDVDTDAVREETASLGGYDTNTKIYEPHLREAGVPEEILNNPDALREAAKDAAFTNYWALRDEQGEAASSSGISSDGKPWTREVFETGEVFDVSEDGAEVIRVHNEES